MKMMSCAALLGMCLVTMGFTIDAEPQSGAIIRDLRIGDGAFLGIVMDDVTADNKAEYKLEKEMGVIVRSVEQGSPAEEAGLLQGDVLLEYSGIPLLSAAQLGRLVSETPVGRSVDLLVSRDGRKLNVSALLGRREGIRLGREGNRLRVIPRTGRSFELFQEPEDFLYRTPEGGEGSFSFSWPRGYMLYSPERPRLGISLQSLTDQMAEFLGVPGKSGILVSSVTEDSPAEGKLRAGDVITKMDGENINDPADLQRMLRLKKDGDSVAFEVIRDKKGMTVTVQIGNEKPGYVM